MSKMNHGLRDAVLVAAAILGDLSAFDELVRRYRSAVVRLARSIAGDADAEDIAQDALLLAFKALPSIEEPDRFGAWLMAITRNRALRLRAQAQTRRRRLVPLDSLLLDHLPSLAVPPEVPADEALERALNELDASFALPLRLHFLDGMPQKRIASFLDVPLSTVKWRVFRGKQLLKARLGEAGRGPTLGAKRDLHLIASNT